MTRPRIALFGIFGRTNLGNEATLAAFLFHLKQRFPASSVVCIGPRGSEVESTFGLELIDMEPMPVRHYFWGYSARLVRWLSTTVHRVTEPIRRRRARARVSDFDLVLVPGTGILDDFGQTALDLPHHLLRWCIAARRESVPVYFVSVGAEPVSGSLTRKLLCRATTIAQYRSFRDEESRTNAGRMGVETVGDPVYPDLAFSLPSAMLPRPSAIAWPPRQIGIGVMGYHGWNKGGEEGERIYQEYLAKMKRFVAWLLERNYSVRLLLGDTRADDRPVRELVDAFQHGPAGVAAGRVIAEPIRSFEDLLREVNETDLVVATRLHNVLLSLVLERPVISISYSRKNDVLLDEFGLGSFSQPIDEFDVDRLIHQFSEMVGQRQSPGHAIRLRNDEYRRRLEEQYDRIFSALGSSQAMVA